MQTKDNTIIFNGLVVDVEQMEVLIGERGWHTYQIVRHPGGAAILPLHEDRTVTLIRQLRPAVGEFLLELPAGRLSPEEDPGECAARELVEETGLKSSTIKPLGILHSSPGVFDEIIHLFLATNLEQGEALPEAYEDISAVRIPFEEALRMAAEGEITDGKTIAALLRAERLLR
ncbi:NUDIX hydrolase [Geomonas sp. RF6]|uniref:NUDIX hydrolase n=1 Tax=Geomonas sp. RF6 TaxID=2897342 RepID=UPI001E41CC69|nr:NUDIX hydrolase [Geomonas sp. RF6]UFS71781.1 NUDIX hydrolase [Geomonas sp. RF6]